MTKAEWADVAFEGWLASLHSHISTKASHAVLEVLIRQPERASRASARAIAEAAGVNVASVIRAAQSLGYVGWPQLRDELRERYLSSLSVPVPDAQTPAEHDASELTRSFESDIRTTTRAMRVLDIAAVQEAVRVFAAATSRLVVGAGIYRSVATALATIGTLAGYPAAVPEEGSVLANATARLESTDVVVAIGFWRQYESTMTAVEGARNRGARVIAVTDLPTSAIGRLADHLLVVPADSTSFFPSLTAALATVNGFGAELAALDPERTDRSLRLAEIEWTRSGLLRAPNGA